MVELIKNIRRYSRMSQQELADYLGLTYTSINRWENGHAIPTKLAQDKLYEYCAINQIPLMDFIYEKIKKTVEDTKVSEDRVLLYHGSKRGLEGDIAPISRKHCDFGAGFYMGTQPEQALTLICDFPKSKFYLVSVKTDDIRVTEIPADIEWAMLVAYHRGRMETIKGSTFYQKYRSISQQNDMIIGSIANDKMFQVLDDFFIGNITDAALVKSLAALQLGKQYVAITQKGCNAVRIEREIPVSYLEKKYLQAISEENRAKGVALVNDICKDNRRNGKYFDELLEDIGLGG